MPVPVPRFSVTVDSQGRVHFDNRPAFDSHCMTLATKHCELSIKVWEKRRTPAQNRAWWKLVAGTLSNWNGDLPVVWHKRIKRTFGIRSTARMTVAEFEELREQVICWAATEFHVVIPDPNELSL